MTDDAHNNGGNTDYYAIPEGAKMLQDIIEFRNMNFAVGNIFKACYRLGEKDGQEVVRDLNKIIWFAEREKARILLQEGRNKSVATRDRIYYKCAKCNWTTEVDITGMSNGENKKFSCSNCGYGPCYYHKENG